MKPYIVTLLAPDKSHTVRIDLHAEDLADAQAQAQQRGRALFQQRGFTYSVRAA